MGFPCLPFDSAFRANFQKRPEWYQWTLDLYREKRFSEALTRDESVLLEKKIAAPVGSFPGKEPGNQSAPSSLELAPGASAVAFSVNKAGVVRRIKLPPPSEDSAVLDNLIVRITTDGAVTAELPVSMFFGGYLGTNIRNAKGIAAGYDGENLYGYFPMPFWASMKIEFINQQAQAVKVACVVGWSDTNPYRRLPPAFSRSSTTRQPRSGRAHPPPPSWRWKAQGRWWDASRSSRETSRRISRPTPTTPPRP